MCLLEKSSTEFALKRQIPARKRSLAGRASQDPGTDRVRRVHTPMHPLLIFWLIGSNRARTGGGEGRLLSDELNEDFRDARVEMRSGIPLQALECDFDRHAFAVDTVARHGLICVHHGYDPRYQRNMLARQPPRVSVAVPPLMTVPHRQFDPIGERRFEKYLKAALSVIAHDHELIGIEGTRLHEDRVGHADFPKSCSRALMRTSSIISAGSFSARATCTARSATLEEWSPRDESFASIALASDRKVPKYADLRSAFCFSNCWDPRSTSAKIATYRKKNPSGTVVRTLQRISSSRCAKS